MKEYEKPQRSQSKFNSLCSPDTVLYDLTGIVRELKRKEIKKKQ